MDLDFFCNFYVLDSLFRLLFYNVCGPASNMGFPLTKIINRKQNIFFLFALITDRMNGICVFGKKNIDVKWDQVKSC